MMISVDPLDPEISSTRQTNCAQLSKPLYITQAVFKWDRVPHSVALVGCPGAFHAFMKMPTASDRPSHLNLAIDPTKDSFLLVLSTPQTLAFETTLGTILQM